MERKNRLRKILIILIRGYNKEGFLSTYKDFPSIIEVFKFFLYKVFTLNKEGFLIFPLQKHKKRNSLSLIN